MKGFSRTLLIGLLVIQGFMTLGSIALGPIAPLQSKACARSKALVEQKIAEPAKEDKRVVVSSLGMALIIDHTGLLNKPFSLANVEKSLKAMGFQVTKFQESDRNKTLEQVNEWAGKIPTCSHVLIYYAGPMVQGEQKIQSQYHPARFVVPSNFVFKNRKEVRSRCVGIWELENIVNQSGCRQFVFLADSFPIAPQNDSVPQSKNPSLSKEYEQAQRPGPVGILDSSQATLVAVSTIASSTSQSSFAVDISQSKTFDSCLARIVDRSKNFLTPTFSANTKLNRRTPLTLDGSRSIGEGQKPGDEMVNTIGQVFCWVPPGTFMMGSPASEANRSYDETPQAIQIDQGFWISKYEVTEREYFAATKRKHRNPLGRNFPYSNARHGDAKRFADSLNKLESANGNWTYTIPNESQWEYACRAGSDQAFHFGKDANKLFQYANFADASLLRLDPSMYRYAEAAQDDGFAKVAPVGSFLPNAWGIHDMHGNVWEWCSDSYRLEYKPLVDKNDRPVNDRGKTIRGGSWLSHTHYCRSAMRNAQHDLNDAAHIGFRVILIREK